MPQEIGEYLNQLHNTLLEILDVVVEICEKNDLTYFLAYGSCLGAVRHKGFIPWDDDIDICMPRVDYQKFMEICKKDLPHKYYFQNMETDDRYWLMFGKIRKKGTLFIERYVDNRIFDKEKQGIFIDIFPLEGIVKVDKRLLRYSKYINKMKVVLFYKIQEKDIWKKDFLRCVIARLFPAKAINVLYMYMVRKVNVSAPRMYVVFAQPYPITVGVVYPNQENRIPLVKAEFENKQYYIPEAYEEYLGGLYGNYMELPPEEKRVAHRPVKVDFGE